MLTPPLHADLHGQSSYSWGLKSTLHFIYLPKQSSDREHTHTHTRAHRYTQRVAETRRAIAENNDDITTASIVLSLAIRNADGGRKAAYFVEN